MFSAKKPAAKITAAHASFISADCEFQGQLVLNCDTRIDGKMHGQLQCSQALLVGPAAQLQGHISAAQVSVQGVIKGKLYAGQIDILPGAKVEGDIYTDNLCIAPGGHFIGEVHPMPAADNRPQLTTTTAKTTPGFNLASNLSS